MHTTIRVPGFSVGAIFLVRLAVLLFLSSSQIVRAQLMPRLTIEAGTNDALTINSTSNHTWRVGPNSGPGSGFGIHDATASATRLKIDLNGNVGIGATNPQSMLDVAGRVRSSTGGFMFPDGTIQTTAAGSGNLGGSGSAGQVAYWTGSSSLSGNNQLFWDATNLRIGVGTTTPQQKLDVSGTVRATAFQGDGTSLSGVLHSESDPKIASTTVNNVPKWNGSALVNGTITDSSGNIGIGRTSPAAKLDVGGAVAVNGTNVISSSGQWLGAGGSLATLGIKSGSVSGIVNNGAYAIVNVTFGAAYPNANYSVSATGRTYTDIVVGLTARTECTVTSKSTTGFTVYIWLAITSGTTVSCDWMTVPYNN